MKRTLILIFVLFVLTACGQTEAAPTATSSPALPTATHTPIPPTETFTPEPTLTPTPMPYYLDNGTLFDLDETTGEYVERGQGIAEITTIDGVLMARDEKGKDVFAYDVDSGEWEVVEPVYEYCMQAVPDAIAQTEQKTGKTVDQMWAEFIADPEHSLSTGGGTHFSADMMSLVWTEVGLAERGFGLDDVELCANFHYVNSVGEVFDFSVPVFATEGGKVIPLTYFEIMRGFNVNPNEVGLEADITTLKEARAFMNEYFTPGARMRPSLQLTWSGEYEFNGSDEILANIKRLMPPGYAELMEGFNEGSPILRRLADYEESDGMYAWRIGIRLPSE